MVDDDFAASAGNDGLVQQRSGTVAGGSTAATVAAPRIFVASDDDVMDFDGAEKDGEDDRRTHLDVPSPDHHQHHRHASGATPPLLVKSPRPGSESEPRSRLNGSFATGATDISPSALPIHVGCSDLTPLELEQHDASMTVAIRYPVLEAFGWISAHPTPKGSDAPEIAFPEADPSHRPHHHHPHQHHGHAGGSRHFLSREPPQHQFTAEDSVGLWTMQHERSLLWAPHPSFAIRDGGDDGFDDPHVPIRDWLAHVTAPPPTPAGPTPELHELEPPLTTRRRLTGASLS